MSSVWDLIDGISQEVWAATARPLAADDLGSSTMPDSSSVAVIEPQPSARRSTQVTDPGQPIESRIGPLGVLVLALLVFVRGA